MPPQLTALFTRAREFVAGFSTAQRTIAIIGIAAVALGGIALSSWLGRPTYAPLFSGLQATDASAVVDQLTADGVPYQLADGGSTVLVPQDKVYSERLKAAANNLPSSSAGGYSLLDKVGVTTSQFQQDVAYKQAMEEELAKTIDAMQGVKNSAVKLAIPAETVFADEKTDPTASVFVETDNGVTLTDDQVQAIVHLTAASIPDMKATDVTVVDSSGNVLSATGGSADAAKAQSKYDSETEASIQQMLDKIVGPGHSTVAVAATLSNETSHQTRETYEVPEGSPATSQTTTKEQYAGGSGTTAGVLGPDNIAVPDGSAGGTYTNTSETKSNALDHTRTESTTPGGQVVRQTVSVAIDQAVADGVDLAALQSLVESAAGYDQERGDVVTVVAQPFSNAAARAAQQELKTTADQAAEARRAELLRTGIIAAAVVLAALAIMVLAVLRRRRATTADTPVSLDYQEAIEAREFAALTGGGDRDALEAPTEPLDDDYEHKKRDISALAAGDPARTAALLRGLMDQEVRD